MPLSKLTHIPASLVEVHHGLNPRLYIFDNEAIRQCDQIRRFIALWASFQCRWQELFCPNCPHFWQFCKGVKIFHFSSAIIFGQLLWRFGDFLLVTLHIVHANSRCIHQHKTKKWPKTNIVWLAHWLDDGGAQAVSVLPMNRVWIPLKSIILSVKLITFKKSE